MLFDFGGKDAGGKANVSKDNGKATEAIDKELVRLATAENAADRIGMAFTEPAGLVSGNAAGLTAFAAGRHVAGDRVVRGMDLLTGRVDPALKAARAAAIVGDSYRGEFVAVEGGVCVLGDKPLEAVEKIDGGLTLECGGLVRAVAPGGVAVEWAGTAPPDISTKDGDESKFLAWLLESNDPGIATLPQKDGPPVTFIRTDAAMTFRPVP